MQFYTRHNSLSSTSISSWNSFFKSFLYKIKLYRLLGLVKTFVEFENGQHRPHTFEIVHLYSASLCALYLLTFTYRFS